jgi:hypothetical protein
VSEKTDSKDQFLENTAPVTFETYKNFFFSSGFNRVLIPVTVLLFIFSEGITTLFYRFLAEYDSVHSGNSWHFGGSWGSFWGTLSLLVGSYFLVLTVKYFMLNMCVLLASEQTH